ncbi:hypothetical protein [Streptomyces sp. B6B3]|uniref:hypothetical protein n=1 Tax=Streptomyces sp. B6B3 TaxID=3153570 RepID=UPI00325E697A
MDQYQILVAGLLLGGPRLDDGSGPPPVPAGHVADRLASRAAPARTEEPTPGRRRRGAVRRRRGTAPAAVT